MNKNDCNKYKSLRKGAGISVDRAAAAISKNFGLNIPSGKIERFERGCNPRGKGHAEAILQFYKQLELQGAHMTTIPSKRYTGRTERGKKGFQPSKAEVTSEGRIHIKDGSLFSTPVDGADIASFPEGRYLMEITARGVRFLPLASENTNPLEYKLTEIQNELEKYRKGYESWMVMKDLVRD